MKKNTRDVRPNCTGHSSLIMDSKMGNTGQDGNTPVCMFGHLIQYIMNIVLVRPTVLVLNSH